MAAAAAGTTLQPELQHPFHHNPQPPQLHRISSCDRHPNQPVTGFCASCLRERLAGLDTVPRRSTSGKAPVGLKSIFFRPNPQNPSSSSSFLPELRRCKSFSCGRGDGSSGPPAASSFEPQRKSCDVRGRNTLWSLFHLNDRDHRYQDPSLPSSSAAPAAAGSFEIDPRNLGVFPSGPAAAPPVLESREEGEEFEERGKPEEDEEEGNDEIRAVVSSNPVHVTVEEPKLVGEEEEVRPMKEHIDLEAHQQHHHQQQQQPKKPPSKDLKEIAGSFWLAASVFSKKLQKWRRKQKLKKHGNDKTPPSVAAMRGVGSGRAEKPSKSRRFRDTQSEIAEDVFGRRSCDTDPRFSLDAGRISFDDPRYSWDEPRASWDGYLIGGRSVLPRREPMLSVVEDSPVPVVQRSDGLIPVEEDPTTPGGTAQTRDYYSDSSQRRRRSLDRSSSVRRPAVAVENEEPKPVSNAKVSPAIGNEFIHHMNKFEREFRDSNSNSMRDDCSESFDSAYRDAVKGGQPPKKSRRWSKAWNIWGFIHRRSNGRGVGGNGVERSLSETWPELRRDGYSGRVLRSNSSVSSRQSVNGNGRFGSMRRSGMEVNGHMKKRREEFVLERNRSTRYSPNHLDNGLLRFYLTPLHGSRRGSSRNKSSNSFTRSVLRLY